MFSRVQIRIKSIAMILVIILTVMESSCGKDPIIVVDCMGMMPTYTLDIKPILNSSCAIAGCHDSYYRSGGYDFSNFSSAKAISQGDRFLGCIQQKNGYSPMPKGGRLSNADINLLTCWVQDGSQQ